MLTKNQILSFLESNKFYFIKNFSVSKIGFFGSHATETQTENSDLDIIVEFAEGVENLYELKQNIKKFVEENLNVKVDLCREKYIKSIFKQKILNDAHFI